MGTCFKLATMTGIAIRDRNAKPTIQSFTDTTPFSESASASPEQVSAPNYGQTVARFRLGTNNASEGRVWLDCNRSACYRSSLSSITYVYHPGRDGARLAQGESLGQRVFGSSRPVGTARGFDLRFSFGLSRRISPFAIPGPFLYDPKMCPGEISGPSIAPRPLDS